MKRSRKKRAAFISAVAITRRKLAAIPQHERWSLFYRLGIERPLSQSVTSFLVADYFRGLLRLRHDLCGQYAQQPRPDAGTGAGGALSAIDPEPGAQQRRGMV